MLGTVLSVAYVQLLGLFPNFLGQMYFGVLNNLDFIKATQQGLESTGNLPPSRFAVVTVCQLGHSSPATVALNLSPWVPTVILGS